MVSGYVLNLLVATAKVVVWFWVIFIVLPRQIFPAPRQEGSRLWGDVVRMGFWTAIIVHILVLIGIYDLFSLIISYALLYLLLLFLRPQGLPLTDAERLFTRFVVFGMDALERRVSYRELARRRWDDFKAWIGRQVPSRDQILWGLALLWVLLLSVYLRLYEALTHAALTPTFYSHLKWLKALTRKELYVDGIYPYGAFTLLSALKQFTFLDEGMLLRVVQGLAGGLTVAAIYFALRRFSGRRDAALLGASLYGIFAFAQILPGLPLYPNEALPLEIALAFLLPTWIFLARYLAEREGVWLTLAFQGTVTVFLIHPFVGAVALVGWVLAMPAALIYGRWRAQGTPRMTLAAVGAVILGNVFYVVGQLGGKEWVKGSLALTAQIWGRWFEEGTKPTRASVSETPLFFVALFVLPLLFFPGGDDALGARSETGPSERRYSTRTGRVTLALALFFSTLLFEASRLGWPELFSRQLAATVASLLACAALGVAYGMITSWVAALGRRLKPVTALSSSSFISLGATVVILAILLAASPPLVVKGASKGEYDAVALKIYDIKQEHVAYTWTIVGTPEVLPHVLGRGWYLNADYFLQNYPPETYRYDPKQPELSIPTEHVYIVVEKNVYAAPSTAEELLQRAKMEQALWDWCRTYELLHDNLNVYYQDDDIIIYHIHHPLLPAEAGVVAG
jgi:hypothetical protein